MFVPEGEYDKVGKANVSGELISRLKRSGADVTSAAITAGRSLVTGRYIRTAMHACQLAFLSPFARLVCLPLSENFAETEKPLSMEYTKSLGRGISHQVQNFTSFPSYCVLRIKAFLVDLHLTKGTCDAARVRIHNGIIVHFGSAQCQPFAAYRQLGKVDIGCPAKGRACTPKAYLGHIVELIHDYPEELHRQIL